MDRKKQDALRTASNLVMGNEAPVRTIVDGTNVYKLKVVTPRQRLEINRKISLELGGVNASLFGVSGVSYDYTEKIVTLSIVLIEAPQGFDVMECLDDALLDRLYKEYKELEDAFRRRMFPSNDRGSVVNEPDGISTSDPFQNSAV